jgi:hypothetical protein
MKFLAFNGLVANPTKTTLMSLHGKNKELLKIKVGNATVTQD